MWHFKKSVLTTWLLQLNDGFSCYNSDQSLVKLDRALVSAFSHDFLPQQLDSCLFLSFSLHFPDRDWKRKKRHRKELLLLLVLPAFPSYSSVQEKKTAVKRLEIDFHRLEAANLADRGRTASLSKQPIGSQAFKRAQIGRTEKKRHTRKGKKEFFCSQFSAWIEVSKVEEKEKYVPAFLSISPLKKCKASLLSCLFGARKRDEKTSIFILRVERENRVASGRQIRMAS